MRVTVLYFAILRERVRCEREVLDLAVGADVGAARAVIAARHPELVALLPSVRGAVNRAFVPDAHALADGDELALIPPVAGGADGAKAIPKVAIGPSPLALDDVVAA